MKFSDMPYERPHIDVIAHTVEGILSHLREAESFAAADKEFSSFQAILSTYETANSIALIRHCIDTKNEFYKNEVHFIDEIGPRVEQFRFDVYSVLYESPFRKEFEEKYGSLFFKNIELQLKSFSPEIIPEMQKENMLVTEYGDLLASAQIEFEGKKRTLSQMAPFKQDKDDAMRHAAWKADASFYVQYGEELDEIYDKLTRLRTSMARKLGFENYIELGYLRMQRNCYTAADVDKFRKAVVKHIVPIADRLYREQAERTGCKYPLSFADIPLQFRSGNPKPCGTPDDILAQAKRLYNELSGETSRFIDFMYENELMDVLSRTGKSGGGFCTDLPDYKAPFIYANFNGTSGDVKTMTHEAGHAFAGYVARNIYPLENQCPTMDAAEVHSMSMEFFAWPWIPGFFGDDAQKHYYAHLAGALTFIPYGTMVDHFQHVVYEYPDMTPRQRHDAWRELSRIYMPWAALDGEIPFYSEGKAWQRQSHIYENPFYYIDYCLAQSVALQFWAAMQKDSDEAWERYYKFVSFAGTKTFTELVSEAGLNTPFDEDSLREVAAAAAAWLDNFDRDALK